MAIAYKCRGCGIVRSEPWEGTCPGYGCYASYQRIANADGVEQGPPPRGVITSLNDVSSPSLERLPSCFPGLDKILGTDPATGLSGIAAKAGQAVQIYGGPGSGKSSLLLQACIEWARQRYDVLYVAGEESLQQIKTRADRFCTKVPAKLLILDEQDLDSVLGALDENTPTIAVVDSLQTISVEDYANGSIMAMRIAAREIYRFTQIHGIGLFVVVQVNKEANNFAGPKEVEHVLDTSLEMKMRGDGKREILCTQKNRFGITPARQLFDMTNKGLVEIAEEEPPPVAVLPVPGTKKLSEKLKEKKPALTSVPEEVDPPTDTETPPEDDPPPSRPPRLSTVP